MTITISDSNRKVTKIVKVTVKEPTPKSDDEATIKVITADYKKE